MVDNANITEAVGVSRCVDDLLQAYASLKKRLCDKSGYVSPTEMDKWVSLAKQLLEARENPFAYMKFVFKRMMPYKGDVFPNMVTSPNLLTEFISSKADRIDELRLSIEVQSGQVRMRMGNGWTVDQVFDDPSLGLSAIYRYALAWSEGRKDLADPWLESARRDALYEPAYRELLKAWLPKDF